MTYNEELGAYLCNWHNYFEEIPTTRALLNLTAQVTKLTLILFGMNIDTGNAMAHDPFNFNDSFSDCENEISIEIETEVSP
jgi:hypothetical protein